MKLVHSWTLPRTTSWRYGSPVAAPEHPHCHFGIMPHLRHQLHLERFLDGCLALVLDKVHGRWRLLTIAFLHLQAEEYKRKGVDLTPELWLVKLLCGAIDPSYDEQDE